jgi:hypothetical protein
VEKPVPVVVPAPEMGVELVMVTVAPVAVTKEAAGRGQAGQTPDPRRGLSVPIGEPGRSASASVVFKPVRS